MRTPNRPALAVVNFMALVVALCLVPASEEAHRQFPPMATVLPLGVGAGWSTWIVAGRQWGAAVLGLVAASLTLLGLSPNRSLPTSHVLPGFLLATGCVVAAIALSRAALSRRTHGQDRIFHGLACYLLIGFAFGTALQRIAILYPGSFRAGSGTEGPGVWADYLWLSFSTLTTAGFSDLVPVGSWARLACALEAVTGVLYPAVFLARLVTTASEDSGAGPAAGSAA